MSAEQPVSDKVAHLVVMTGEKRLISMNYFNERMVLNVYYTATS